MEPELHLVRKSKKPDRMRWLVRLLHKLNTPAKTRWYQFTLRRILGATGWAAIWCCAIAVLLRANLPSHEPSRTALTLGLFGAILLGPFVAIGTLVGHPYRAFAIGVVFLFAGAGMVMCAGFAGLLRPH